MSIADDRETVPVEIAAKECGLSSRQFRNLCKQGLIGKKAKGSNYWTIFRDELEEFKLTPRRCPGSPKKCNTKIGLTKI